MCIISAMHDDLYRFGLTTPSLDLRAELPLPKIIDLVRDNAPYSDEAEDAVSMISGTLATAGRYDGEGWSIWFARRQPTLHERSIRLNLVVRFRTQSDRKR